MASTSSAPPVMVVEPQYCPQAVIDWYKYTGDGGKPDTRKKELSMKAEQHLCALGWDSLFVSKNGRWELRYKSPTSGKNYYSLRMACENCIKECGYGFDETVNISSIDHGLTNNAAPPPVDHRRSTAPLVSSSSAEPSTAQENPTRPRRFKKPVTKPRRFKKRRKRVSLDYDDDDDEEEYRPVVQCQSQANSLGGGEGDRLLRSSKRSRLVDDSVSSSDSSSLRNPRTVISWLIDHNVVFSNARVLCRGGNNGVVKTGRLFRHGINCDCCGKVFSMTRFEAHAGCTKHRPSASIFLEDGRSLMDCQGEALRNVNEVKSSSFSQGKMHDFMMNRGNKEDQDLNDSICSVCHYGGELILCDRCPSSFHHTCLGLEEVPDGDWFCPPCCCKICNRPRCREDCADHVDNSVLVCAQCERKYHIGCLKNRGFTCLKTPSNENWFCSRDCDVVFFSLQNLIGKPIPVGADNLTWTLMKTTENATHNSGHCDLEEGLLEQIESKLSVALGVMHECFEPVTEALTGRDLASDVVFSRGSELNRSNFRGFYTVVLERNEEVISVATIRILGKKFAEVPLVATRMQFRKQGMCRVLMNELEKQLSELGVERMILPSAHNVIDTWTNSFGFARMTDSEKSQFVDYTFLDFQDTIMCHKLLLEKHAMVSRARPVKTIPCINQRGQNYEMYV